MFHSRKCICKYCLQNGGHFAQGEMIWYLKVSHAIYEREKYFFLVTLPLELTHWVSKLTITGSDNGMAPDRHQAIIWTNAGILLIGP